MSVIGRKQLRKDLAQRRLRTLTTGVTTGSPVIPALAGSTFYVLDRRLANPEFTADALHVRSWVRVASTDYRVGSFNAASGVLLSAQVALATIASGMDFEVYGRLAPTELDSALDETILEQRVRREVTIPTVDGATAYALDGAGSPHTIVNYLDVWYYAAPTSTVNRDRRNFVQAPDIVRTGSGIELRLGAALGASQQIAIDALLQMTLGAGDEATINLPDEETVLWGGAARAYDTLIQHSPSQESALFERRRAEAARSYTRRMGRFLPVADKPLRFGQAFTVDPLE